MEKKSCIALFPRQVALDAAGYHSKVDAQPRDFAIAIKWPFLFARLYEVPHHLFAVLGEHTFRVELDSLNAVFAVA
jgi:hypothetical protein